MYFTVGEDYWAPFVNVAPSLPTIVFTATTAALKIKYRRDSLLSKPVSLKCEFKTGKNCRN